MPKTTIKVTPDAVNKKTRRFTKKKNSIGSSPKKNEVALASTINTEDQNMPMGDVNFSKEEIKLTPKKANSGIKRKKNLSNEKSL